MSEQEFLLEIGCEELPASSLLKISVDLGRCIEHEINGAQLKHGEIKTYATPRRLAVLIEKLSSHQPSQHTDRLGPAVEAAYDKNGMPTPACLGFVRSCGITAEQLEVKDTPKGQRVYVQIVQPGLHTIKLLPQIVAQALKKLPLPKEMRWSNSPIQFIRPVHWIVMLYGHELVNSTVLGKQSCRDTQGHRFHHPQKLTITEANQYNSVLYSQGYVVSDYAARKNLIRKFIQQAAEHNEHTIIDETLLDEVTSLVEWPVVYKGRFNPDFLTVPKEVLITSMQTHQKCFALTDQKNNLLPHFVMVSNIESKLPEQVIHGNERVMNARLSDAAFFYHKDLKHSLESLLPRLEQVKFQQQLGNMAEKAQRISQLSGAIAEKIRVNSNLAQRAGLLAKCDLLTEMVGEFPTLQGIMGYYYALNDKEPEECALAIKEHYHPRYAGDDLPHTPLGCTVSLANRLDTLIGILGINQIPTGDKDPFALRRLALGLLRILIEKELPLDLIEFLQLARKYYSIDLPNKGVIDQAYLFIMQRLKTWYLEQGVSAEIFEAVMARKPRSPFDFHRRIIAVQQFQKLPEASALAAANKRVSNILKKEAEYFVAKSIDPTLFEFDAEKNLAKVLDSQKDSFFKLHEKGEYTQALSQLAILKEPIDTFFDEVMIMVDNEKVRNNRLALLSSLRHLFMQVADISVL